jgi:hypothetical protein
VNEAIKLGGRGGLRGENDVQHRDPAAVTAVTPSAGEDASAVLPPRLEDIVSIGWR